MDNNKNRIKKERLLFDLIASRYDRLVSKFNFVFDLCVRRTKPFLRSDFNVLDIGSGTGLISLQIASDVKKIVAVDISPKMTAVAKEKAKKLHIDNIEFKTGDGYSLPYKNESFDVVLLVNMLHIAVDPDTLVDEANRSLKKGGYLVTYTDCYAEPIRGFSMNFQIKVVYKMLEMLGLTNLNRYKKENVEHLLVAHGFRKIDEAIGSKSPLGYYMMARKR